MSQKWLFFAFRLLPCSILSPCGLSKIEFVRRSGRKKAKIFSSASSRSDGQASQKSWFLHSFTSDCLSLKYRSAFRTILQELTQNALTLWQCCGPLPKIEPAQNLLSTTGWHFRPAERASKLGNQSMRGFVTWLRFWPSDSGFLPASYITRAFRYICSSS